MVIYDDDDDDDLIFSFCLHRFFLFDNYLSLMDSLFCYCVYDFFQYFSISIFLKLILYCFSFSSLILK